MARKKALRGWETKLGNCEVTPQALWPIAKSLMERNRPKTPTAVHVPLGIKYHPNEKVKVIADYLETLFTSHNQWDENNERQVETRVASVDDTAMRKIGHCDIHKLRNTLKLRKACGLDGIPNKFLRHLPRRVWDIWYIYLITVFGCPTFQNLGRKQKL
jgi:recombination DNA repair RAD52 pathway protein